MIFYFLLISVGIIVAAKLILNELRKERLGSPIGSGIKNESQAVLSDHSFDQEQRDVFQPVMPARIEPLAPQEYSVRPEISKERFEFMLKEKTDEINRFKNLLEVELKNKAEYEKIKNLLQCQIFESRKMNKEIQRELKSLKDYAETLDAQANKLKAELIYKDQLLLKKDYQLTDLNAALQAYLLPQTSEHLPKKSNADSLSDSGHGLDWRNKN